MMNGEVGVEGVAPRKTGPGSNWKIVPLMMACPVGSADAVMFGEVIRIVKLVGLAEFTMPLAILKIPPPLGGPVTVTCWRDTGAVPEISVKSYVATFEVREVAVI